MSQDRRELRLKNGTGEGEALIPFGWIMHQHGKAKTGYLGRIGLCRALIWPFIYKHYAVGDFAEFLETYGLPIILGKYYQGASPAEKTSLMRAVTMLGHDARAIMPKEMELEISKITGSGDGDAHLRMVDWAERSQSKCILGQTLSAEAQATGMGSGVADLHGEVRHDILKADARRIAATLTRDLLYPLLALNGRGGNVLRRCPRWVFDLGEAEDLKAYAETLPVLAAHGARISVEWVHTKLRIPIAEEGEALFGQPQAEPIQEADAHARAALKAQPPTTPAPDAIDALIERDAENWQPLIAPLLAPIQRALDDAIANNETAAQFIARLPALLAEMDTTPLTEKLTRAAFIARLAGLANLPMDND